jgi:organic hydroperoxide reductase OsmC/OhrA
MAGERHRYQVTVTWRGNRGTGTSGYRDYDRDHEVAVPGKPTLPGSSDPAFRGDAARWNPEELLVASLSQCHMLWYLHLCAQAGIVVTAYTDEPVGVLQTDADGGGRFVEVLLRPRVVVDSPADVARAERVHGRAHELCFLAASVAFPVRHEPVTLVGPR